MKQYTSNALLVAGKPAIIKSNCVMLNTVERGALRGYWPRLADCSLEDSDTFQEKLQEVLTLWKIPFHVYHTTVLDLWHPQYCHIDSCYKDHVERILIAYYQVGIDC